MTELSEDLRYLKIATYGCYDLQQLRIQSGLRLIANFRARLELLGKIKKTSKPVAEAAETGDISALEKQYDEDKEAESVIDFLRASYRNLMEGVARNRTLPDIAGFKGDEVISTHAELAIIDSYMQLETQEKKQFRMLLSFLDPIPIYTDWLEEQKGVGPAMAGVLISTLDPHRAKYISSFWKYAGLDLGPDERGRSRRQEHLVDKQTTRKDGTIKTHKGITYNPFLKTKLMGVLGPSFLRSASPWREQYDNYKHRIASTRKLVTLEAWKKAHKALPEGEPYPESFLQLWPPGRVHQASMRYMVKMFLAALWVEWRRMEGLPVTLSWNEAQRGRAHGEAAE